ncbi:MAG: hypothetical protein H7Y86_19985 [Rhizobacter sp.]|nr:hypothetical protein [Ferruginibacter sp.]
MPKSSAPIASPPALPPLRQALANARSQQNRRRTAIHIIQAYQTYYNPQQAGRQLQLMHRAATSIQYGPLLKRHQREELLFFYEFTGLLIKATAALNRLA